MRSASKTDCRDPDEITVGLMDSIINAGHLLKERDLTSGVVFEAISDLRSHVFLSGLFSNPQTEWRVVYREMTGQRLSGTELFKVESEARDFAAGRMWCGVTLLRTWQGIKKEVGVQRRYFGVAGAKWEIVDFQIPKSNRELVRAEIESDLYTLYPNA